MAIRVITMVEEANDRMANLVDSCERHGLKLEVLERNPWIYNSFKLRMLYDFLKRSDLSEDELLLVVDAYDVIITSASEELFSRFQGLDADIVFSAEANYYFRESDLTRFYWLFYPRDEQTVFHYLNSGSFMGKVGAIRSLLRTLAAFYQIDFADDKQLITIRSDQYIYSRFYADYKANAVSFGFSLKLDSKQQLFGCTGGRMAVVNWKPIHWIQDYLFFKYERRWLKTFWLKGGQTYSRDFRYDGSGNKFLNKKTSTQPLVMHLPGTHKNFKKALSRISGKVIFDKWFFLLPVSVLVSMIAYIRSIVNFWIIKVKNRGQTDLSDIFPRTDGARIELTPKNRLMKANGIVKLSVKSPNTPSVLSGLSNMDLIVLVKNEDIGGALKKLIRFNHKHKILDENESGLENIASDAVILNLAGDSSKIRKLERRNLIIQPEGFLKRILLNQSQSGAYPKDNPFTILN